MGIEKYVLYGYAAGRGQKDNVPVRVTTNMQDLIRRASSQNFVPVVDDKDTFIGIVTRSAIIKYCCEQLFPED